MIFADCGHTSNILVDSTIIIVDNNDINYSISWRNGETAGATQNEPNIVMCYEVALLTLSVHVHQVAMKSDSESGLEVGFRKRTYV